MKNSSFLLNLPFDFTINILSRLPIRTIAQCKCVCKILHHTLSTPEFAKSYLSRPTSGGLIVNLTQDDETKLRVFEYEDELDLESHDLHYKPLMSFDPPEFVGSPTSGVMLSSSVNGLLCLHDRRSKLDALCVCNPITREYISVPGLSDNARHPNIVTYGFGVSKLRGLYKVVRIFHTPAVYGEPGSRLSDLKVECSVYTLGTCSWRSIDPGETYVYDERPGPFLKGNLHWLVGDSNGSPLISCLELETELFKPLSPPPLPKFFPPSTTLAVLGDCLWFCDFGSDDEIVVWVMKEYGVKESWTKEYIISKELGDLDGVYYESVIPLKVFRNGDIVFFWENTCLFYYNNKSETAPEIDLFERDEYGQIEALSHTPSFISLKEIAGENAIKY